MKIKKDAVINKINALRFGSASFHSGVNNQKTLFWWSIDLDDRTKDSLKDDYKKKGYRAINITPYFVGQECWTEIKEKGHFGTKDHALPNIDESTGNLHPLWGEKETAEWLNKPVLRQAVLVKAKGPKNGKIIKDEEDVLKAIQYSDCYFPPLNYEGKEEFSLDNLIKGLLKNILDESSELYKQLFTEQEAE